MPKCNCNTHGFGPKRVCSIHANQLRKRASEQTQFAYKWFKIAEQYKLNCKCKGSCSICNDFNKAVNGE